ncbi:esterase/lipase family protein [Amycolatopsis vastitatis]|uniref:Alpha/beta hydrolase n=1 Tax=Amycolatopsis vastitatis TaxID=1905142 RepID=A0A229SRA4_9PSEU|nr:alpha/beta fold hydrolase [Amycolatopsis vastitatis]OXM61191.1 alpha/beta hydrolase [Amycolatopsis vastitatis]
MTETAIPRLGDVASGLAATAVAAFRLPALPVQDLWAGSVLESAAGHHVAGVAAGMFGGRLPAAGRRTGEEMTVRAGRRPVGLDHRSLAAAFPGATGNLVVFLHGLVETERSWFRGTTSAGDFGARLATDVGASPVYVRYNSGRHVSDNGDDLVALLSRLVAAWPVPVTDIVLIGHSMGGLVARSALYRAQEQDLAWLPLVTRLVCLGTPHSGAPLERRVAQFAGLLRKSPLAPLARLLALRSDGIQDLAHGYVHQHQWADDPDDGRPLERASPSGLRRLFVSATLSRTEGSTWGRLLGDLLVPPVRPGDLTEDADTAWLGGLNHFALLRDDSVYETLLDWLRTDDVPAGAISG